MQTLVKRFQAAFQPKSRRPHGNPRAVGLEVDDQIIRLRKQLSKNGLDAGAETVAVHLATAGVSPVAAVSTTLADLVAGSCSRRNAPIIVEIVRADQTNQRWQADITHWRLADGS